MNEVHTITLEDTEREAVQHIITDIPHAGDKGGKIEVESILPYAHIYAQQLPRRIREQFYDFQLNETSLVMCVANNPFNDGHFGPTPSQYPDAATAAYYTDEEALHLIYAALLGEPYGSLSNQDGHIINDIIPIFGHEDEAASSGSHAQFDLHTEDSIYDFVPDYLGLLCIRNPTHTPTIISSIVGATLPEPVKDVLFQPRFFTSESNAEHKQVAVLWGARDNPYIRIEANIHRAVSGDQGAKDALAQLTMILEENVFDLVPEPGLYYYIDNRRAVHGRRPYAPAFDGQDRWLKRLVVTTDLRSSRALRRTPADRVLQQ